ncbi:hypothetical protein C8R46DRAFT_1029458 [Mycena filopes]|nr:hypothetical protein C8R46DRAFT_1029458 [Mycena filopes]
MAVDPTKLNTMRSPFVVPSWPARVNTFLELSDFIDHPDSDFITNAEYHIDFHHPRPPYHERDDSAYVAADLHTPFAFTLFGKLREDEVAFGEQTQVLTQPVIQDDWDMTNTTAATCTDAPRAIGSTGTFIQVQRGARCILHTVLQGSVEMRHITPQESAQLVAGAWVLLKCTLHRYDGLMAEEDRDYEVCAWHVRVLPDIEASSKSEDKAVPLAPAAESGTPPVETMPDVSTPMKLRPRPASTSSPKVQGSPQKLAPRAIKNASAEGVRTRSMTVGKRHAGRVVKASQAARKVKAEMVVGEVQRESGLDRCSRQGAGYLQLPAVLSIRTPCNLFLVRAPMAGINSLAPEVLTLILAEARNELPRMGVAILRLRRDVCMVCKDWQQNAVADQDWWTSVWLAPFLLLPFMQYGLGAAPDDRLDITIDLDPYQPTLPRTEKYIHLQRTSFLAAVAAFLRAHLHRVRGLHVLGLTLAEWRSMAPLVVGCTGASLRTLEVGAPAYYGGWLTTEEVAMAGWASLTTLVFNGVEPLPTGLGIYSTLDTLKMSHMQVIAFRTDFMLSILREASALTRLDLGDVECIDPGAGTFAVTMATLRHLRIGYQEDRQLDVLRHISAPHLRSFCIQAGRKASPGSLVHTCGSLIEQAAHLELGVTDEGASLLGEFWNRACRASSISIRTSGLDTLQSMRQHIRSTVGAFPQLRFLRLGDYVDHFDVLDLVETADPSANLTIVCPIRALRPTNKYVEWTIQAKSITSQVYEGTGHQYIVWDEVGYSRQK